MDREQFRLQAAIALFAAFRTDAKPSLAIDDAARALGDADVIAESAYPKPPPEPEPTLEPAEPPRERGLRKRILGH